MADSQQTTAANRLDQRSAANLAQIAEVLGQSVGDPADPDWFAITSVALTRLKRLHAENEQMHEALHTLLGVVHGDAWDEASAVVASLCDCAPVEEGDEG